MDCLAGMTLLPDHVVDLVLTDLPYGVTACKWDSLLPLDQLWEQWRRVLKPRGAVVLTGCQPFTTRLIQSNPRDFKYCWYWKKPYATGFCFAKYQPMRCIEDVVVFYRQGTIYHPQGLQELPCVKRQRKAVREDCIYKSGSLGNAYESKYTGYPKNLLEFPGEHGLHPTQKPVPLFAYLIRTYTDPGALVLDCCMGSGTTAIACLETGRHFIGYEIDETYYARSIDRIAKWRAAKGGVEAP